MEKMYLKNAKIAKCDLQWNKNRSAIVGAGSIFGAPEELSLHQEIRHNGKTLLKKFTFGGQSWTIGWKLCMENGMVPF